MILVPELNLGQLGFLLRATYLIETIGLNKVQGQPFRSTEMNHAESPFLEPGGTNESTDIPYVQGTIYPGSTAVDLIGAHIFGSRALLAMQ